jgi:SAM-dependent methyltransferase
MFDQDFRRLMKQLHGFNARLSLLHRFHGLSPARCFEYPLAVRELAPAEGSRVLDIGSGKSCLPLYLTLCRGARVTVIDPSNDLIAQRKYAYKMGLLPGPLNQAYDLFDNPRGEIGPASFSTSDGALTVLEGDATAMRFGDAEFDAVACVSTIEHIPDDGDTAAVGEIARVLVPGGRAFISVPYAQQGHEGRTHGGAYERRYDRAALYARLVAPSNLTVVGEGFLVDQRSRRLTDRFYYRLPGKWRYLMGWYCIYLTTWLARSDAATASDAQFAYLVLEKARDGAAGGGARRPAGR